MFFFDCSTLVLAEGSTVADLQTIMDVQTHLGRPTQSQDKLSNLIVDVSMLAFVVACFLVPKSVLVPTLSNPSQLDYNPLELGI